MIRTKYIPTDRIRAMEIYINRDRLSLSAIVEREGPDLAITGNFYGPDWKPVCPLKADGQVVEYDPEYAYPALCWDDGPDMTVDVVPRGGLSPWRSYIANCAGIYHGQDQPMIFGADVGGRRGRTGWGLRDGALALVAFPDGIDGSFGPGCDSALRACQADLGLEVDGSCGPATLAALAAEPTSYYTSKYTGEEMDALLDKVAAQSQS